MDTEDELLIMESDLKQVETRLRSPTVKFNAERQEIQARRLTLEKKRESEENKMKLGIRKRGGYAFSGFLWGLLLSLPVSVVVGLGLMWYPSPNYVWIIAASSVYLTPILLCITAYSYHSLNLENAKLVREELNKLIDKCFALEHQADDIEMQHYSEPVLEELKALRGRCQELEQQVLRADEQSHLKSVREKLGKLSERFLKLEQQVQREEHHYYATVHEEMQGLEHSCLELERLLHQSETRRYEAEQKTKGFVKFVSILGTERWGTPEQVKGWKIIDMDMRNGFARLTPRQFEELIADLLTKMGYKTRLTPYTVDYGTDIVARKENEAIVVQAKRYGANQTVGNREIQRLLGSMLTYKASRALFVTSSDFTRSAYTQARGTPIELWNSRKLCQMIEKYML